MAKSILDVRMQCPECMGIANVGDCEPDIDGEGSLGCPNPKCMTVDKKPIVMQQMKKEPEFETDIMWEDPECDINAAVIQIQEMLQYLLDKDAN